MSILQSSSLLRWRKK